MDVRLDERYPCSGYGRSRMMRSTHDALDRDGGVWSDPDGAPDQVGRGGAGVVLMRLAAIGVRLTKPAAGPDYYGIVMSARCQRAVPEKNSRCFFHSIGKPCRINGCNCMVGG